MRVKLVLSSRCSVDVSILSRSDHDGVGLSPTHILVYMLLILILLLVVLLVVILLMILLKKLLEDRVDVGMIMHSSINNTTGTTTNIT
jgi:hypothetical protein